MICLITKVMLSKYLIKFYIITEDFRIRLWGKRNSERRLRKFAKLISKLAMLNKTMSHSTMVFLIKSLYRSIKSIILIIIK
jgi:hypothetical protein